MPGYFANPAFFQDIEPIRLNKRKWDMSASCFTSRSLVPCVTSSIFRVGKNGLEYDHGRGQLRVLDRGSATAAEAPPLGRPYWHGWKPCPSTVLQSPGDGNRGTGVTKQRGLAHDVEYSTTCKQRPQRDGQRTTCEQRPQRDGQHDV